MSSFKSVLLTSIFFIGATIFAQIPQPNFEVRPTAEFISKKREVLKKMLFSDDSGHYVLFAAGKNGLGNKSIRKLSNELQPLDYRVNLSFRKKVYEPSTIEVIVLENKIFHIWTAKTREGIGYFSQEIDVKSEKTIAQKLIARVNFNESLYGYTQANILVDKDSKRVYLNIQLVNKLKNNTKIRSHIYDENINEIRTDNYEIPYSNTQFKVSYVRPYGADKLILIGKNFHSENWAKSTRRKEYDHLIYSLADNKAVLLKTIPTNDQHLNTLLSKIVKNNLIIMGMVGNQNTSKPSSLYFLNYNLENSTVEQEHQRRIPDNFYDYPEEREEKLSSVQFTIGYKQRTADSNYFVKNLISNDENDLILTAEQNFAIEHNSSTGFGPNGTMGMGVGLGGKTHYSGDIVVFKMTFSGELLWTKKIIKQQEWGGTTDYLSFFQTYKNNKLFLFYNGNYLNIESGGNFLGKKDSALMCTIVQSDGSYQRNVIAHYTEEYPNVSIPSYSNYTDTNGVFIYSRAPGNIKRQKFTNITLN